MRESLESNSGIPRVPTVAEATEAAAAAIAVVQATAAATQVPAPRRRRIPVVLVTFAIAALAAVVLIWVRTHYDRDHLLQAGELTLGFVEGWTTAIMVVSLAAALGFAARRAVQGRSGVMAALIGSGAVLVVFSGAWFWIGLQLLTFGSYTDVEGDTGARQLVAFENGGASSDFYEKHGDDLDLLARGGTHDLGSPIAQGDYRVRHADGLLYIAWHESSSPLLTRQVIIPDSADARADGAAAFWLPCRDTAAPSTGTASDTTTTCLGLAAG